jgi:prepilin signal peptidase PulO-like enzyme (type II secretory pathway)
MAEIKEISLVWWSFTWRMFLMEVVIILSIILTAAMMDWKYDISPDSETMRHIYTIFHHLGIFLIFVLFITRGFGGRRLLICKRDMR